MAQPMWGYALISGIAAGFGLDFYNSHVTLSASASSDVNNSTLAVALLREAAAEHGGQPHDGGGVPRAERHPIVAFACPEHASVAAADDLGIVVVPLRRGGRALDAVPESESALTVTGTAYAPGDESYTDAPAFTNAPGDAAPRVTTAALFVVAATALLGAVSLF
jgi:hypothetical protein